MPLVRTDEPEGYINLGFRPELSADPELRARAVSELEAAKPQPELTRPALMTDAIIRETGDTQMQLAQPLPLTGPATDASVALGRPVQEAVSSRPPKDEPSVLGAAFRQENLVASAIAALDFRDRGAVDETHDPFELIRGTQYEPYYERFAASRNEAETRAMMARVDQEMSDRRVLSQAGFMGHAASMAASVLDPTLLIPLAQPIKAARLAEVAASALKVGASAAAATAVQEAGLHATQELRTKTESGLAIGGSFVLGSLLGGAISGMSRRSFDSLATRFEDQVMRVPADTAKDPFGMGGLDTVRSAGAAAVDEGKPAVELAGGIGSVGKYVALDPVMRTLSSPLNSVREIGTQLFETVLGLTRNAEGVTTSMVGGSVETRIKTQWMSRLGEGVTELDRAFSEYRFARPDAKLAAVRAGLENLTGRSQALTYKQFKEEVGRAMSRNDEHAIPQVAKAAKAMRAKVITPGAEDAIRVGLLDKEILKPAGGAATKPTQEVTDIVGQLQSRLGFDPSGLQAAYDAFSRASPEMVAAIRRQFVEGMGGDISGLQRAFTAIMDNAANLASQEAAATRAAGRFSPQIAAEVWDDAGQSYITRIYNKEKIKARYGEFKKIITEYLAASQQRAEAVMARGAGKDAEALSEFIGLSRGDLEASSQTIVSHILGHPDGRMLFDLPDSVRGPLKARTLRIKDALIEEFLERDIETIARFYTRSMGPDVEMTRAFGSIDMKEQFAKIGDEADALALKAATEKERSAIFAAKEDAQRDLSAMADRLRGTYAMPADPTAFLPRLGRTVRTLNYMRLLGGMTVSAIPDTFRAMQVHGVTSYFKDGWLPLIKNLEAVKLAGQEVKLAGTALDMILDTRAMAIADVMDDFGRYSKFERATQSAQSNFGIISLMAPWNAALKQWSGMITMTNILRACQRVADGTAGADTIAKLARSNIDESTAKQIAFLHGLHGKEVDGVFLPNTTAWDLSKPGVRKAQDALRGAIALDVDRIIVTPGQDKPLWFSTEVGKIVAQFKSFGFSSAQRVLLANLQQRDAGVLMGSLMMIGMGAIAEKIRAVANQKDGPQTLQQWALNSIDRSGLTAYLFDVNHFAERMTGGAVGFAALTGGQPMSRYAARNWADAIAGPTGGLIKEIASATSGASHTLFKGEQINESDIRALRRALPYQNLFYFSWLFQQLQAGAVSALNAKPLPARH